MNSENLNLIFRFVGFGLTFLLLGMLAGKFLIFLGGANHLNQPGNSLESCD
jgi:hypothetical protein